MSASGNPLTLAISGLHYNQLRQHLFPGDGKEAVAIAVCGRSNDDRRESLLVREIHPIPHASCRVRTPYRVTWSPEAAIPALTCAMNGRLAIVKIHSHPNGVEWFSQIDDESDTQFFDSVFGWLDTDLRQASLIMLPCGRLIGRSITQSGLGKPLADVRMAGDDFIFWRHGETEAQVPEHARRIAQIFGEATYANLRALRVGVVGCSGTGSVVVEQLARYCVGELVLVDPDFVEHKNLNRILNSTIDDARNRVPKVEVMQRAVGAMGLGVNVNVFASDLFNADVIKALSSCDIVFGCMDSIDGRHLLNKIASYYLIPYIDMGVRIDADGNGGVNLVMGAIHTMQPGGSSLLSRGVYTQQLLNEAFLARGSPETFAQRVKEDYIKGVRVDQPAVISLNMQIAATAINELMARIHPYRLESNGSFAIRRIVLTDPENSTNEHDGRACDTFGLCVGLGDQQPPLGIPDLGRPRGNTAC